VSRLTNFDVFPDLHVNEVSFSSASPDIATVSRKGTLLALSPGEAAITLTVNKVAKSFKVTVTEGEVHLLNLPAGTKTIESEALAKVPKADVIRIPASVESIAADAFDPDIVLLIPKGSPMVQWAKNNGYTLIEESKD